MSWVLVFSLFTASIVLYLRYIERRTLFYPAREIEFFPDAVGLAFEDVFFKTPDKKTLNGWFVASRDARFTILFCHGNAGNIGHRLEKIRFFNQLGCNVFIFDYRGYGKSKGRPSEKGLYIDASSAYDYLLSRRIVPEQIIGYGESLGGAVAIDLASKDKLCALIVDSSFSCGKDMARRAYPFIPYWVFSVRLDSAAKIKSINIPKLIIHSLNDEIVPYELAGRLYDAAARPKQFLQIQGGHNSCFYDSLGLLREGIADFLNRLPK